MPQPALMHMNHPETITKQEFANDIRVCVRTVENLIRQKAISVIRIGRAVRIDRAELRRFKESRTIKAVA